MREPDVTLTDYVLAVECALFAGWLLLRSGAGTALCSWFAVFFAGASSASLFGGTVHGLFPEEQSAGHRILWPATLLAIGVATLAGWSIGARLVRSPAVARWVRVLAWVQLCLYGAAVLLLTDSFALAVANYVPAALFLLGALVLTHKRSGHPGLGLASWGIVLSFCAAAIQQLELGVHPVYLSHNAVYHVVQAVAFALIFLGARDLLGEAVGARRPAC
jgi:hypothetical protein